MSVRVWSLSGAAEIGRIDSMTYLCNAPADFVDEATAGFVAANRRRVCQVTGGVIRRQRARPGQVVVVIGGGSGHYPAFAGVVGPGLAHAAVMGNVFASPSAQQIYLVAKAVEAGGGVLFCYGNYAGDVLNFNQAQARLRAEGIDARTVVVTDDIASAPPDEPGRRRGIAGDLPVFKAASVAADAGAGIDEVFRLATEANARVRTIGVAFSGCTLPGARAPLFTVQPGRMEVGMGIHGEPGLYGTEVPTANGLADLLVDRLLEEIPPGHALATGRVGVMLNGLGAIKYEELFVVYRQVEQLLAARGLTIIDPEVGELVTSFDMAGVSLTLFWLTGELEQTWRAPADTPAFRKGSLAAAAEGEAAPPVATVARSFAVGGAESQACARTVLAMLHAAAAVLDFQADELGRLDAVAGDGDHGIGMQRGVVAAVRAATEACAAGAGAGSLLGAAGEAWADRAGGTSGALWGVMLRALGGAVGDLDQPAPATIAAGWQAALRGVTEAGKARVGDKTLVDALEPFVSEFRQRVAAGATVAAAWSDAATAAEQAAQATASFQAQIGRARPHAEKSIGTPDPGAVSLALVVQACARILKE
ncbi:MAG TPA: dihydroxyacetone kinase family protein [Lacunisphaera sp.]|nr:dihydroxyacetone kinase family protein [Lacunisphaera sp.]